VGLLLHTPEVAVEVVIKVLGQEQVELVVVEME
jgi:hypothetical protein